MEKYLLDLIKEHNRVIVPNFGAFIVSREKGLTILFNSFLNFNDGLLISHISNIEGVDSATVTSRVEMFVETIKSELDSKGIYTIDNLGTFSKDSNNILRFTQKESFTKQETESDISNEAAASDTSDLLDFDPGDDTKDDIIEEPVRTTEPLTKEKLLVIDTVPPVVEPVKPIDKPEAAKPVSQKEVVKPVVKVKHKTERRGLPLWLVILLIIIPILLILGYFLFFKGGLDMFKKKAPAPVEQVVEEQKVEEQAPVVEEPSGKDIPSHVVSENQHHIILGSFKEESNAVKFVEKLKEKGLNEASVINYKGRFLVSAEWHSSVDKAFERQEVLLNELQIENWVLTIK